MKVVVVGGGFGGLHAARRLMNKGFDITLINPQDYFLFTPLLVEFTFGVLKEENVKYPLSKLLGKDVELVRASVESIDFEKNVVSYNGNELKYDYLIVAIGGVTGFFDVGGAKEFSFTLTSIDDCHKIKNRIEELLNLAGKNGEKELNFIVVGGGGTGVSIACELRKFFEKSAQKFGVDREHMNISIIFMEDRPLQLMERKKFSILAEERLKNLKIRLFSHSTVSRVGKDFVEVGNQRIPADMIIWAAGTVPNKINMKPDVLEKGHIKINEFLQIPEFMNAYALGDCSFSNKKFPKTVQVTLQQARTVVKNIVSMNMNDDVEKFTYKHKGNVISLGNFYGVAHVGKFVFSGFFAWFLWKIVHLMHVDGVDKKLSLLVRWIFGSR